MRVMLEMCGLLSRPCRNRVNAGLNCVVRLPPRGNYGVFQTGENPRRIGTDQTVFSQRAGQPACRRPVCLRDRTEAASALQSECSGCR
jgi:hypothetical protein